VKKLLCLNVEILSAFEQTKPIFFHSIPMPALCSAFVTTSMLDSINGAQQLIEENNLVEVVYHTSDVNWFSSLDKIIYQTINSRLHVTKESIFYSGAFAPEKTPAFVSMRLPLSCITPTSHPPTKELNLSFLSTDTAKALIDEIENLEREMQIATDRYESLEGLSNAIEGLKTASIIAKSNKTNALAHEVSTELKLLIKATEVHETAVQEKCEILCKRILNVSVGDRIISVSHYKNKSLEIQVESVRYYNGTMYLDGPKVLKNGSLGKRSETAYINLVPEDEHQ
jgi:hypothetical protein